MASPLCTGIEQRAVHRKWKLGDITLALSTTWCFEKGAQAECIIELCRMHHRPSGRWRSAHPPTADTAIAATIGAP